MFDTGYDGGSSGSDSDGPSESGGNREGGGRDDEQNGVDYTESGTTASRIP